VATIFEHLGYRVVVYTCDRGPPHVHVVHGDIVIPVCISRADCRRPHWGLHRGMEPLSWERTIMRRQRAAPPAQPSENHGPWARSVTYDALADEVRLTLENGATVAVPRRLVPELCDVPPREMGVLTLLADGAALVSEAHDAHVFIPGLVASVTGLGVNVSCVSDAPEATSGRAAPSATR
jgi:hypothetical protein